MNLLQGAIRRQSLLRAEPKASTASEFFEITDRPHAHRHFGALRRHMRLTVKKK